MYTPIIYDLTAQRSLHALPPTATALPAAPLCLALGNFDGVHIGHKALLARTVQEKMARGGIAAVWTFLPEDTAAMKKLPRLTDLPDRLQLFAEAGIDYAILAHFDQIRQLSPEAFVSDILQPLSPCVTVCGYNYRFGHGGKGDTATLQLLLDDGRCTPIIIPPVTLDDQPVNSTAIRTYIEAGEPAAAARLLGRPFSVFLPVVHGHALGRKMGIPTINQTFPEGYIIPKKGVYACTCQVGEQIFSAITNIGTRPTVSKGDTVNCETHILHFDGDLYGEHIRICFHTMLRPEQKFADLDALTAQIRCDIAEAEAYFSAHPTLLKPKGTI